ncbi:sensor histidine kinase [Actinacidiphila oryziradicis]|uniref:Oxygen sensor histidine kinase NreB n=1 Tax=Actinacidiphila oryziradicis TaxID=2571141 RepID=A0A4U0SC32_9ACTN|nr:sensor histidine kinase [Actinacidiphila oryziradicis]TKA06343.1 sensor histidine kinase [Actinacidiphila oryziradicis]
MNQPTPIFAVMSRTSGPPSRWRRARWLGFLLLMLAFNAYPVSDLVTRGLAWPACAGVIMALALIAGLWVRTMWLALATTAPFRDIAPWLAAVALLGAAFALGLRGQFEGLLIYVSIACAVSLPMRWVLPALTGAALATLVTDLPHPVHLGISRASEPNTVFSQLSFVFFLGLMMWFYRRTMMLINELRQAREDLARLAVTEERLRFARDLHDLLGHTLSTISLKSQLARRLAAADPELSAEIADIESVTQQALVEIRQAVTGYRQTSLADELDTARAALAAAGIEVYAHIAGTPLPALADGLLGWVVREAATNVLRHSQAHICRIRLTRQRDIVMLDIRDDGIGLKEGAGAGNGLTGLAERLTAAGGTIDTGTAPGKGFGLTVRLPLTTSESLVHLSRNPVSPRSGTGTR